MQAQLARKGFIIAGLVNIVGILIITRGMSSPTLAAADPAVFSQFGIIIIMLWGLAYIGTASFAHSAILLPAAFALEKLAYTVNWLCWISAHSDELPGLLEQDRLGGIFLAAYGINDGLFGLFFAAVALGNWLRRKQ